MLIFTLILVDMELDFPHVWQNMETPRAIPVIILLYEYCREKSELTSNGDDIVLEDAIEFCRFLPHYIDVGGIIIEGQIYNWAGR